MDDVSWSMILGRETVRERLLIPKAWWRDAKGTSDPRLVFWQSGDCEIESGGYSAGNPKRIVRLFDVRFEPAGVYACNQPAPPPSPRALGKALEAYEPRRPAAGEEPETRGAPVSDAKLARWYEFFRELYPAPLQSEDAALAHAKATFPANHVARARIRAIRGPQARGRKAGGDLDA
jgi:hypothetical protein